jgi:N-acetylglutamate synthase-like GNAT family acetyltransferase
VEIREATEADAARIAVLCGQLGYAATGEQIARRLERLGQGGQAVVLVAVDGSGLVIGFAHTYVRALVLVDRHAELGGLVVDEPWRGSGLGSRLLAEAERWSAGQGCETLYARSNADRAGAHGFYEAVGYERIKSSFVFWKRLGGGP